MKFAKSWIVTMMMVWSMMAVGYVIGIRVVHTDIAQTNVAVRIIPADMDAIPVWPVLQDDVALSDLMDGPYWEVEDDRIYITCYIPFDCTNEYLALETDKTDGLRYNLRWPDGSSLTRSGMLYLDGRFYSVDFVEKMAMEFDLYEERIEDAGEVFATNGVSLEAVARYGPRPTGWRRVTCQVLAGLTNLGLSPQGAAVISAMVVGVVVTAILRYIHYIVGLSHFKRDKEKGCLE